MPQLPTPNRRQFIVAASTLAAGAALPLGLFAKEDIPRIKTVGDAISYLIALAAEEPYSKTVDTVKSSDVDQPLRGIVTTFMPNVEVIRRAVELGANLIVSHEPVFYNHLDQTDWLAGDPVYEYKRKLLEENHIVVFRYHDYLHSIDPDPVVASLVARLGWDAFREEGSEMVYRLPNATLGSVLRHLEEKLDVSNLRYIGQRDWPVKRIGLVPGAPGGQRQIEFMSESGVDLLITGEIHEWETSEYTRDAIAMGVERGLIVLGHQPSEEDGMAWLAELLKDKLTASTVTHVPSRSPFSYQKKGVSA